MNTNLPAMFLFWAAAVTAWSSDEVPIVAYDFDGPTERQVLEAVSSHPGIAATDIRYRGFGFKGAGFSAGTNSAWAPAASTPGGVDGTKYFSFAVNAGELPLTRLSFDPWVTGPADGGESFAWTVFSSASGFEPGRELGTFPVVPGDRRERTIDLSEIPAFAGPSGSVEFRFFPTDNSTRAGTHSRLSNIRVFSDRKAVEGLPEPEAFVAFAFDEGLSSRSSVAVEAGDFESAPGLRAAAGQGRFEVSSESTPLWMDEGIESQAYASFTVSPVGEEGLGFGRLNFKQGVRDVSDPMSSFAVSVFTDRTGFGPFDELATFVIASVGQAVALDRTVDLSGIAALRDVRVPVEFRFVFHDHFAPPGSVQFLDDIVLERAVEGRATPSIEDPYLPDGEWDLVFEEDFDGPGESVDEVWDFANQAYTHIISSRWRENAETVDGHLRLIARKEERAGQPWTAASAGTKESFKYGYFECRYRAVGLPGTNNSFWLMTIGKDMERNLAEDPAANRFEIDVNEGRFRNQVNTNVHRWSPEHTQDPYHEKMEGYHLGYEFAVFGLEWNEDEMIYYFNGQEIRRTKNEFCQGWSTVFLSLAILDWKWTGEPTMEVDGRSMDVDYVRIYRRAEPGSGPSRTVR